MRKKAVLITGGAGYIGSVCTEMILEDGKYEPVVLDNLATGFRQAVHPKANFVHGDFGDRNVLDDLFEKYQFENVIHFAGATTVTESMTNPAYYYNANVIKGFHLLEAMKKHHCQGLIFSSTAAAFGEPQYSPIDEDHPKIPISAYGQSKLAFEGMVQWYHVAHKIQFSIFRYFNAAGASKNYGEDHPQESHLIPLILDTAIGKRDHIKIFGTDYPTKDGTCVRDYVHVEDIAQAHILAMKKIRKGVSGAYNLGNGSGFSVQEVVDTIKKVTGKIFTVVPTEKRPGDPAHLVASSKKAKNVLKWKPKYPKIEQIVKTAWDWKLAHPNGYNN